jgi:hypothetical protein
MCRANTVPGVVCAVSMLAAIACVHPPPEEVTLRSDVRTADGLQLVEGEEHPRFFLRPGVHLEDFSEILIDPFSVSYASPRDAPDAPARTLDVDQERRLTDVLHHAFTAEMERSRRFELVEQPSAEAIRVQGWLLDLVVEEPPSDDPRNFPLCFAELNVILTVRDSETAQALARMVDRVQLSCAAEPRALFYTAKWSEVEEALRPWALLLRRWLEDLHELPAPPA